MAPHKWHRIADMLAERLANHADCHDGHPCSAPEPGCPFCADRSAYEAYLAAGGTEFRYVPGPDDRPVTLAELAARPPSSEWQQPRAEPAVYLPAKAVRGRDGHAIRPGSPLAVCGARAVASSQDAAESAAVLALVTCVICDRQLRQAAAGVRKKLAAPPPVTATARYAFNPRQGDRSDARYHAVIDAPLTAPRFARAAGDALCKPASKFWGLSEGNRDAAVDCPRCIVLAGRFGVQLPEANTRASTEEKD